MSVNRQNSLVSKHALLHRNRRHRRGIIPTLEPLEDRLLPSLTPQLLRDVNTKLASANPADLTTVGDTVFFVANDGLTGFELWKSNGIAAGTALVRDIVPGITGSFPEQLTNVNGTLFFTADDG